MKRKLKLFFMKLFGIKRPSATLQIDDCLVGQKQRFVSKEEPNE